jgi:hypothetical protein
MNNRILAGISRADSKELPREAATLTRVILEVVGLVEDESGPRDGS